MSGGLIPRAAIRRALVRCPNWLGDTVMALPTLRALRAALPDAELWCVGPWVPALLEAEPGIDRRLADPGTRRARLALARTLARERIDLALLLPNSFEAALHAWLSRARWRVGYGRDGRSLLLTQAVAPPPSRVHQVVEYLALLAPLGIAVRDGGVEAPVLHVAPSRQGEARRLLVEAGVEPGQPSVGLQLGAAFGPSKLWPPERLAAVATRLTARGITPVFLGSAAATPLLAAVTARLPAPPRHLVGKDHPALLPALIREFSVLLTPDSGPGHVAAAVGVPVVVLFGPTDPRLTAPVGPRHAVLWHRPSCAPCFSPECPIDHRCMRALTVDEVFAAVCDRVDAVTAARGEGGG